jgi:hypothetical protein
LPATCLLQPLRHSRLTRRDAIVDQFPSQPLRPAILAVESWPRYDCPFTKEGLDITPPHELFSRRCLGNNSLARQRIPALTPDPWSHDVRSEIVKIGCSQPAAGSPQRTPTALATRPISTPSGFITATTNHHHPRQRLDSACPGSRLGSQNAGQTRSSEMEPAGERKEKEKNIKKIESYEGWPLQKRDRHDDRNGNDRNRRTPAADRSPFSARPPRRIRSPLGRTREGCQPAAGTGWILPLTVLSVHSTYICMYGLHLRARMGASSCGCNCFALL